MPLGRVMEVLVQGLLWLHVLASGHTAASLLRSTQTDVKPGSRDWICPDSINITGITCSCDVPHTVRCRGEAISPEILKLFTRKLALNLDANKVVSLLDLSIHKIERIPAGAFENLNLMGLVISRAQLTQLNPASFKGLEQDLAALGLPGNELTEVPSVALRDLKALRWLDLGHNHITRIDTHQFPTLVFLDNLNLNHNQLAVIQTEAFARLPQLKALNLANNQLDLHQLNERTLWGLRSLKDISLQSNLLKGTLTPTFLSSVHSLQTLDLSNNYLTKITLNALSGCGKLSRLDLSHNHIDVIEDHAFQHLNQLRHLDLSHNNIVAVSGWSLAHLPSLGYLGLADNSLLAVTADLLHQIPNLETLDVASNDITIIQPHVFNYTPSLAHIDFTDNPLHCDCSLTWLWKWLDQHVAMSGQNSAVCATPPSVENAALTELNVTDLLCAKDTSDYYHDAAGDYEESPELRMSEAEISLRHATWTSEGVRLVWHIDQKAIPYRCQSLHIYEMTSFHGVPHQILANNFELNCTSGHDQPNQVIVHVPTHLLTTGRTFRYCLVLIESGTGDEEGLLPGCSEPIPLNEPQAEVLSVTSLTAGAQQSDLVVQTKFNLELDPCVYQLYIVHSHNIEDVQRLNCSESRHTFATVRPGTYFVCVGLETRGRQDVQQLLNSSKNVYQTLTSVFRSCTAVLLPDVTQRSISAPVITLLFTLPGLALLLTLYILGRRIWKSGGIPCKWDPRAHKRVKYFLYTGESASPNLSLDPLPSLESTTRV